MAERTYQGGVTVEDLVSQARTFVDSVASVESDNRDEGDKDLAFKAGDQWPSNIYTARVNGPNPRPALTINKLPAFVNQVVNNFRMNLPGVLVQPVGDGADQEVAEVIQGLGRHITAESHGESALRVAFESAVDIGWGYFRLLTDYEADDSFNQDIRFAQLPETMSVFFDPHSQEPDGCDARECVLTAMMSREEFGRLYPDAEANNTGLIGTGDIGEEWLNAESVQLAEYYYCDYVADRLLLVGSPRGVGKIWASQLPEGLPPGLQVLQERPVQRRVIRWAKLSAVDVLEERVIPGTWIPVIPVYGGVIRVKHQRKRFGLIRFLRDPQTMLNYWETTKTELLALQPRAPWVGPAGFMEGREDVWAMANNANVVALEYNMTDVNGVPTPIPPQRMGFPPPPTGVIEAAQQAAQHMKEISGIYDASLGNRSNETSGVGIRERKLQGDVANFHFYDNAQRSLLHSWRIILSWVPKYYDQERVVRILGDDGTATPTRINVKRRTPEGVVQVVNDVTVGRYAVVLSAGPNYQTRREAAVAGMSDLARAYPPMMAVAGDLMVKNLDWPGSDEIARRLRATIDPKVLGDDTQDPETQVQQLGLLLQQKAQEAQHLNAYAQQQEEQVQTLTQENAQLKQEHALKQQELALQREELAEKARMDAANIALKRDELQLRYQSEVPNPMPEALGLVATGLQQQIDALRQTLDALLEHEAAEAAQGQEPAGVPEAPEPGETGAPEAAAPEAMGPPLAAPPVEEGA